MFSTDSRGEVANRASMSIPIEEEEEEEGVAVGAAEDEEEEEAEEEEEEYEEEGVFSCTVVPCCVAGEAVGGASGTARD